MTSSPQEITVESNSLAIGAAVGVKEPQTVVRATGTIVAIASKLLVACRLPVGVVHALNGDDDLKASLEMMMRIAKTITNGYITFPKFSPVRRSSPRQLVLSKLDHVLGVLLATTPTNPKQPKQPNMKPATIESIHALLTTLTQHVDAGAWKTFITPPQQPVLSDSEGSDSEGDGADNLIEASLHEQVAHWRKQAALANDLLKHERQMTEEKLLEVTALTRTLQLKDDALVHMAEDYKEQARSLERAKTRQAELKDERDELLSNIDALHVSFDNQKRAICDQATNEILRLNAINHHLMDEAQLLFREGQRLEQHAKSQFTQWVTDNTSLRDERDDAVAKLTAARAEIEKLTRDNNSALVDLQNNNTRLLQREKALEEALQTLDKETTTTISTLRTENDALRNEATSLQDRHAQNTKAFVTMMTSSKASADGLRHIIRVHTETIEDLKKKLAAAVAPDVVGDLQNALSEMDLNANASH